MKEIQCAVYNSSSHGFCVTFEFFFKVFAKRITNLFNTSNALSSVLSALGNSCSVGLTYPAIRIHFQGDL